MPDWITHLGTAYVGARAARISMIRPLLLGALLPDLTRFSVLLIDFLDWPAVPTFAYLIPFHSLLIVSLLAGAIALFFDWPGRVFWLIEAGAAFHFLLDDVEGQIGCGSTTFYPFYFGKTINLWPTDGMFAKVLLVIGVLGIGVGLVSRAGWHSPNLRLKTTRDTQSYLTSALLVSAAAVIPLLTRGWLVERNAYYLAFLADPQRWEGKQVELCFSEILSTNPPIIEEFDTQLQLATDESLAIGDWVSTRGTYRDGAIHPELIIRHQKSSDLLLSVLAGIAFVVLWLPPMATLRRSLFALRRDTNHPKSLGPR